MNTRDTESEYTILKILEKNPNITQRDIASELNMSLGKINYIVRALIDKGIIKLENFRKSDNKIGYAYVLTPRGLSIKATLASNYFIRKTEQYKHLKAELDLLEREL